MAIAEDIVSDVTKSWESRVEELRTRLQGELIGPGESGYNTGCATWNAIAEGRPALIVRCADALDVAAALAFARGQGLAVAVRSGGHSVASHSTLDGGVVLDLSPMKGLEIDPGRRVARL